MATELQRKLSHSRAACRFAVEALPSWDPRRDGLVANGFRFSSASQIESMLIELGGRFFAATKPVLRTFFGRTGSNSRRHSLSANGWSSTEFQFLMPIVSPWLCIVAFGTTSTTKTAGRSTEIGPTRFTCFRRTWRTSTTSSSGSEKAWSARKELPSKAGQRTALRAAAERHDVCVKRTRSGCKRKIAKRASSALTLFSQRSWPGAARAASGSRFSRFRVSRRAVRKTSGRRCTSFPHPGPRSSR